MSKQGVFTFKKSLAVALLICVFMPCAVACAGMRRYSREFFGAFDTIVRVIAYARDDDEFNEFYDSVYNNAVRLHRLFDIYHTYPDMNNLKTVNDNAGIAPVQVEREIIELINFGIKWHGRSGGTVNIALGPVLSIWHDYRERHSYAQSGELPPMDVLEEANALCLMDDIIVDETAGTVFLAKEGMSLDVGAIAKGFAVELIARGLEGSPVENYLIDAGGNVLTRGAPYESSRKMWSVGVQDPFVEGSSTLEVLGLSGQSAVTSGDYQRFYTVNGARYCHIIDSSTLMPAANFRSVTVISADSGDADAISTALFVLPYEQGLALAQSMHSDAVWVFPDGSVEATPGARALMLDK